MSVNLRDKLRQFIALNNYVSAYRSNSTVPVGYTQVEYVERPSGNTEQCVETAWKPNMAKNIVIQGKATFMGSDTNYRPILLGNYTGNRTSTLNIEFDSRTGYNFRVYSLAQNSNTDVDLQVGPFTTNSIVEFNVNITGSTGALDVSTISNGITLTGSGTVQNVGEQTDNVMMLFKDHRLTTTSAAKVPTRIYYLKAIEDGITKIDLVPAIRNSDSEVGFYDKVSGQFLTNSGTGSLTSGSTIIEFDSNKLELSDAIHDGLEDLILYGSAKASPTEYLDTVTAKGNSAMNGIPSEYTEVKYVQNAANTLVKTGTSIANSDNFKMDIVATATTSGAYYIFQSRDIVGTTTQTSSPITGISGSVTDLRIAGAMGDGNYIISDIVRTGRSGHQMNIVFECVNGNTSLYVKDLDTNDDDIKTGTYITSGLNRGSTDVCLFGNDATGTGSINRLSANEKVYYAKLWKNGGLALDLVPVKRKSDNVVGLYNRVNGQFLTATEGSLTAGSEVVPTPSDPMDIYDNNGILTPYLDAEGSSSQARIPTPTAPIDMINYKQGLVELRKVGTIKDTLTHGSANATITRNVGVKVLDGTEDFALVSGYTDIFRTPNNAVYPSDFASNPDSNVGLCNNYKIVSTSTSLASNIQDGEMGWNTNGALTVRDSRFTTAAQFKAWLAQMYAAGTPVVIYYPLATATTESILPAYGARITRDYEELEYITATGTQYIETGLSGPMRWLGAGQGTSDASGSKCILGALTSSGNASVYLASRFGSSTDARNKRWTIDGAVGSTSVSGLTYAEYDIDYQENTFTGTINTESTSRTNTDTFTTWFIGSSRGTSGGVTTNYPFVGNIYEQKAYQNNVLVGDFIPARRKSDFVIGMYDAVSGQFYTNSGTGDFTAGPSMYRNLANVATDIDGKYIAEDGSIGTSATSCYSAIIPVVAGETYVWSCTCGNSGQKNNKRVHAYIDGVWNQQIFLEEVSAGVAWSKSFTIPAGCNGIRISHWNTDTETQVELGSTKTSYVPYKIQKYIISVKPETLQDARNYTATCQDLLYVNNTRDTQEILSGNINRNCRIAVFDGSETGWMRHSTYYWFYDTEARFDFPGSMEPVLCSSLPNLPAGQAQGQQGQFVSVGHSNGTTYRIIIANNFDSSVTVADFKAWLEQKYYEGNPVIVVYKATTPATETVDAQLMKKAPVEITQVALSDSTVDTTNRTVSTVSPEYPLDIACNNGLVQYNRVYTGKWKLIKNPTQQSNKAIYIKVTNSTWTALSDRSAGAVIPLRVGDTYKITFNYNSLMYNNFIRYGEVDDSTPPVGQYKPVYNLQVVSPITNDFTYTFTAGHPYLAIQATATTVENGRLEEAFVIENITSSLPAPAISPLAYTGYEELEYIEGTTTGSSGSYIDTLIKPNSNTKVEVKFSVNELGTNQCVIGSRNAASGTSKNGFAIWGSASSKIRFDYQSAPPPFIEYANSANTIYTVIKDKEKNYVDGVQQDSNTIENFKTDYSMLLFAINSGTSRQSCLSGKIYYCKIWDNDILVRDFIPVKRVSDDTIGMYDRVSKTFFANSGSSDFVGGPSKGILQNTETAYVNSKNLYNPSTDTNGYYIAEDGTIAKDSKSCYSDIIPVISGHTYTWSGICGGSSYNNKRVHAYIDGVWNQQILHERVDSGNPFAITFTVPAGVNGIRISHFIADTYTQVEEGPRPTRYEVYGRNIIKPVDLWSTYQYLDAQNISTGNLTRNTGVIVFDGTEDWTWTDNANAPIRLQIPELAYVNADTVAPIICSHFTSTYWNNLNATTKYTPYIAMNATTQATAKRIVFTAAWNPNMLNIDVWKAWLAEQYDHGTPLMIIYPRLTPTDGNAYEGEDVVLTSSNSEIERDSEYINNLGIGVNYKKLK